MLSVFPVLIADSLSGRATWSIILVFIWAIGWAILCLILGRRTAPDSLNEEVSDAH